MVFERSQKRSSQPSQASSFSNAFQRKYLSDEEEKAFRNRPLLGKTLSFSSIFPDVLSSEPVQKQEDDSETETVSPEVETMGIENEAVIQEKSEEKPKLSHAFQQKALINRPHNPTMFNVAANFPTEPYQKPVQEKADESVTETVSSEAEAMGTENEEVIQEKSEDTPNLTGLPDDLKAGVENLSGYSLDDVRVHYNSPKPAQLQAKAYTKGTEIHVASGQEEHLPHEAWHVVQQMQGRVKPTVQMESSVNVNDDYSLEKEADMMGKKAECCRENELRHHESTDMLHQNEAMAKRSPQPTQIVTQRVSASPLVSGLIQRMKIGPKITNAATNNNEQQATNNDTVAVGPAHLWEYNISINDQQADIKTSMAAIRAEYTAIGQGFTNHNFISEANVKKLCKSNKQVLNQVFGIFQTKVHINQPKDVFPLLNNSKMLDELLNQNVLQGFADPIRVIVSSKYNGGTLTVTIEYTEGQKGYISQVKDTASNIDAVMQDRPNYAGEFPVPGNDRKKFLHEVQGEFKGLLGSYSNIHHTDTNEDVGTQVGRLGNSEKYKDQEAGVDAITKIIAEGGRFQAVAALGTNLRNDSVFFTSLNGNGNAPYRIITLRELWKTWTSKFKGNYGIADDVIAQKIKGNGQWFNEVNDQPEANGHNYDLDNNQVH